MKKPKAQSLSGDKGEAQVSRVILYSRGNNTCETLALEILTRMIRSEHTRIDLQRFPWGFLPKGIP